MNFILTASSILFPLITFPYITRVLLAEGTGKIAFASSAITYFTMIASLGIPTYGIRTCAKIRDDKEKLSKTVQELLIINSVTMFLTCIALVISVIAVPEFAAEKELFIINGIGMVLNMFAMNWLYNALEQYGYITICNLVVKVVSLVLMFLLVKKPSDYIIYGAITMFASSASYVFNFIYAQRFITLKKSFRYEFKKHLKPILVFFAMSAATSVYTNLDVVMLGIMKTPTDVGYYDAAIKIKTILVTMITSLGTVLLPRLSYYVQNEKKDEFYRIIGKAVNFVLVAGLPVTVYFSLFAKESILFISGEGFLGAVVPMVLLMPTVLLIGLSNITGIQVLTPQNEEKKVLYSILCGAAIDFILNLLLIPGYGAAGAAFATLMAELLVLLVQCVFLKNVLKHMLDKVSFWKIIFAVLLGSGVGLLIKSTIELGAFLMLVISACAFFGIYVAVLLALKEKFTCEILEMIPKVRKSKR